jgi:predicted transcriptional regulator
MMINLTDDLTINVAQIASVETSQRHYMNGPSAATLIVTMDNGRQHRIPHGHGVDIYALKKQIEDS